MSTLHQFVRDLQINHKANAGLRKPPLSRRIALNEQTNLPCACVLRVIEIANMSILNNWKELRQNQSRDFQKPQPDCASHTISAARHRGAARIWLSTESCWVVATDTIWFTLLFFLFFQSWSHPSSAPNPNRRWKPRQEEMRRIKEIETEVYHYCFDAHVFT